MSLLHDAGTILDTLALAGRLGRPLLTTEGRLHVREKMTFEEKKHAIKPTYNPLDELDADDAESGGGAVTGADVAAGKHGDLVAFYMCPKGAREPDMWIKINHPPMGFIGTTHIPRLCNRYRPGLGRGADAKPRIAFVAVPTWHEAGKEEEWSVWFRKAGCFVPDLGDAGRSIRNQLHALMPGSFGCIPAKWFVTSHIVVVDTRTRKVLTRWGKMALVVDPGVERPDWLLSEWRAGRSGILWRKHIWWSTGDAAAVISSIVCVLVAAYFALRYFGFV